MVISENRQRAVNRNRFSSAGWMNVMTTDSEIFAEACQEFLSHLCYTQGYRPSTGYAYHSDLKQWAHWLAEHDHPWDRVRLREVEQFITWQLRERGISVALVNRRLSALSHFYRWAMKQEITAHNPVALVDKPKRPHRLPIWLEKEEQSRLNATLKDRHSLPVNLFGQTPQRMTETRRRYEMLFGLLLHSGLRISEALQMKVTDVRIVDGIAKSLRVLGKGNKERLVPLPESFGAVFGFWLNDRSKGEWVFAKGIGQPPMSPQAARGYLRGLLKAAGIDKKITPHKLRHTYATNLLNAGAELVDIQVLLGHVNLATTQIYTHVDQERMTAVVNKL